MKSAVIINLDYERHDAAICRRIWKEIESDMAEAGFVRHFRMFLADMDREHCCRKAREVVAAVENRLANEGILAFDAIREFYWFEYRQANDLLAPANDLPEVSFVDTDAFEAFLVGDNPAR